MRRESIRGPAAGAPDILDKLADHERRSPPTVSRWPSILAELRAESSATWGEIWEEMRLHGGRLSPTAIRNRVRGRTEGTFDERASICEALIRLLQRQKQLRDVEVEP